MEELLHLEDFVLDEIESDKRIVVGEESFVDCIFEMEGSYKRGNLGRRKEEIGFVLGIE